MTGSARRAAAAWAFRPILATLALAGAAAAAGEPTCDDLSHIDFGVCAAVLGYGVIGTECRTISGCESPVPLFETLHACRLACEPTCDDLSHIDFGPCDAVLGAGVIGTQCAEISGCESPVPLFETVGACRAACEAIGVPGDAMGVPADGLLGPNHPNPVRFSTAILFRVPAAGKVQLDIYDITGRLVRTLASVALPAGTHVVSWDRTDDRGRFVAGGVYLARLVTGGASDTRRIVVKG